MTDEVGEGMAVRPGSWSGAKAREGSPEDLRDPICVHARASRIRGGRHNKSPRPGRVSEPSGSAKGEHEQPEIAWAAGANQ
jgi:hypothetical protein